AFRGDGTRQASAMEQKRKRTQRSNDMEAEPRPKKQVKWDTTTVDTPTSHSGYQAQKSRQDASFVASNTWDGSENVSIGEDAGVQPSSEYIAASSPHGLP
ncbi:hypothetical protein EIP86_004633, partial [Pleurotus ostreatoroseus]